jgi:hypothetical protein
MTVALGRLDQDLDLVRRQVLWAPSRGSDLIYLGYRGQIEMRFCHRKQPP